MAMWDLPPPTAELPEPGRAGWVVGEVSQREPGRVSFAATGCNLDQGVLRGPLSSTGFQTSRVSLHQPETWRGKAMLDPGRPGLKSQLQCLLLV